MTNYIKKLLALAVTVGAMTALADAPTAAGTWTDFSSLTGNEGGTIVSGDYTLTVPAGCTVASDGALVIGSGGAPSINYTDSTTRTVSVEVEISDCNDTTEVVPINVVLGTADGACVAALNGVLSQRWYSTWGEYNHGDWDPAERQIVTFTYSGVNGSDAGRGSQTYINGESAINQNTGMISIRTAISGIRIGCKTGTEKLATGMKIYAIRIYTSRLSNAEVAAAYEAHKPVPAKDSSTPVLLVNINDVNHAEGVANWINHTQTDGPNIPKSGVLGPENGVNFKVTGAGNFANNHAAVNTDYENGEYLDIFGESHTSLIEEVTTSLALPEGTSFTADVYKSGVFNGGQNNHTATISNLDSSKLYVIYAGFGLVKTGAPAQCQGFSISESGYESVRALEYVTTVNGMNTTKATSYTAFNPGTSIRPGQQGLLLVRMTDVVPKQDGTVSFTLAGERAGLNFLAVAEVTRNTPTKLVTALSGEKSWSELEWAADGKAYKWIDGNAAEIEVTAAATLTLDPSVDVKSIKLTGSSPLMLTTADGVKPDADFLAKLKLTEYTGRIAYGWNDDPTVIAINFNARAASDTGAGASDDHKLGNDENANILGLNIFGSTWAQFTDATQATAQTVDAIDTATEGSVGSASVTWRSNNNYMYRDSQDKVIRGYLDDGSPYAQVNISDIPFSAYDLIVICATDTDGRKFNPVTVNGTNYRWNADSQKTETTTLTGTAGTWGQSRGAYVEYGRNAIKIESLTSSTLAIVGGANANSARGGIAAVILVESKATIPEITGDLTMSELAEKAVGDEALVLVTADATITQDGTSLDCRHITLRAEETKTLSFALTADQLTAVAALADGAEYDVVTAVFGLVPTFINVELKLTNLPEGFAALEVAGAYKIVKQAPMPIFTPANDSDWAGVTLPFYAKEFVATTNKSFAADTAYLQRYDGIESTVAVVTAAPENALIYGLHAIGGAAGLGDITRDIYLKVTGGTPAVVSGGEDANWSGTKTIPTGNVLLNISGNTVVDYVYGAGLGGGNDNPLATIDGNVGIVIDGNAQVKGTVAGGWHSKHNATPEVTGNTTVLVKNVQTHDADATFTENVSDCPQGWIVGGGIFTRNGGKCKIGGNSAVVIDLADGMSGEFMKRIAGGGHNIPYHDYPGGGDGCNTVGDTSVTITAPNGVIFSHDIMGGGHATDSNSAKTGGNSIVTLNGGTYTGTIIAAGDNGEHTLVTGTATINVTAGDFTAATFVAGTATAGTALNISGGTFVFKRDLATGFDAINFSGNFAYSFPDGTGAYTPIALGSSALSIDGVTSGQATRTCDVQVGEIVVKNATVIFNCDACTVSYTVAQEGTLRRRPDFEGMTDDDRRWTATGSWLDADDNPVDWPMSGAKIVHINADEVASIIVDAKINADMINLTNTATEEGASFEFKTLEPLDEVATPKENPDCVILGKLTATGFGGALYLQSRITMAVALGENTHVFFVAWEAEKETTAYPYEFTNMANPICKVGPGAFIVPSSMYTYAFNVKGGSLIYDIPAGNEATVSGVLQKDTPADPETHLLIKRGAGTMTYATGLRAGFLDGLEVRAGTLKLQNSNSDYDFVGTDSPLPVTVKSGATLDLNGQPGFAAAVTLEGGAKLANSNRELSTGEASLRSITLTGDATVEANARFGLLAIGYGATKLNLGGHTLTKTGAGAFHLCATSGTDTGTITVEEGTFHIVQNAASLPNVTVKLGTSATFDVGAATTIGGLTLGPTYTFAGSSTLTTAKKLKYAGAADSVFTWYAANLGEGATIEYPSTAFTMKFPSIPTIPVALPTAAKVELTVPNLMVGYVYPITGVTKENVIVKVGETVSTAARVEVTDDSIKILPPLSRPNPVTGEEFGFVNAFRGTTDANWATTSNWYTGSEGAWTPYAGEIAPMMTDSNAWDPALVDGNLIADAANRTITLAAMEGWYIRLGLFNGATVTVDSLVKIQNDNPATIMVDETSRLNLAPPTNSKASELNLYIAGSEGLTWTAAYASEYNTLNYHFAGEGSVAFAAGASAGTHSIKRFDLTIGDPNGEGMQKGIVSKKLISFGATSAASFTLASDVVIPVVDAARHPTVVPTKSAADALTGNEALGTYYLLKAEDGVYVKYIGYSTDPEKPLQTIIDKATNLSTFTFPTGGGEVIVLGGETWNDAFDIVFDCTVPDGVTFSVNGYVNIKSTDDAGILAAIPLLTIPASGAGAKLFLTALPDALSVVQNKFIYRVSSDLSGGYQLSKGAATYEFVNARLTNQNGANYKLYVADGDVLSLAGANNSPRTSPSLIVDGGSVTLGASSNNAFWYGGVDGQTTYVQTAGRVEVPVVGTATSGSGSGLLLGFSGSGLAMSISGGELLVPNSALNFWVCPNLNLSGTGYVKAKGVFKGSNNGTVTISENAVFDLGSIGWQGIAINLNGGKLNAFESATVSMPITAAAGAKLGASAGAELTIAQPITAAGTVVISGPGTVKLAEGSARDTDLFEVESGVLDVGLLRPIVNVHNGAKVRLTATEADIDAGKLVLKIPAGAAEGGTDKVEIVDGNGSAIRIKDVSIDPEALTVTVTLATVSINESMTMSAIKTAFPEGGTLAITGSAECDDSVKITLDEAVPTGYSFTVSGHVTFAVSGSVTAIPLSKIVLNDGGCLVLNAPIAETALSIAANTTVKTRADQTITLTNNGTFVVKSGATATVTASGQQAIKGTVTIEKGATFVNTYNDAIAHSGSPTTVNVYGTLAMGTTRWTVGGQSAINLYGSADVTGAGDGEAVFDVYRSGNTISVFNIEGEDPAEATIEGLVRSRNNDGNIWIQKGAKLALTAGITGVGSEASSPKITRQGNGFFTGTIPLAGPLTLDYGTQLSNLTERFRVTGGEVTLHITGKNGTDEVIAADDTEANPFIEIAAGATLNLNGNNYSGSLGATAAHGWIVNKGTLVFQDGNGYRYFRQHLVLNGGTVKLNSGDQPVIAYGGIGDGSNAQFIARGGVESQIIIGVAGSGNGKLVLNHAGGATGGVGFFVEDGSKLTISAPIEGTDPLAKWGTGTLNIGTSRPLVAVLNGVIEVTPTDAESVANEIRLPTTLAVSSKANFHAVNETGSELTIEAVVIEATEEGGEELVIRLRGVVYTKSMLVSELPADSVGAIVMSNSSDEPIILYVDQEFPERMSELDVRGNVEIRVTEERESYGSVKLFVAEGAKATVSGVKYPFTLIEGTGELYFDPGEGNVMTVNSDNTAFTGSCMIASGTVKMGHSYCFGPWNYNRIVRVMAGAALDTNAQRGIDGTAMCVRLAEGATLTNTAQESGDIKFAFPITKLILEGNAFIRAEEHRAGMARHWNNGVEIELGAFTLTKVGSGEAYFSSPTFRGTGTLEVREGTVRFAGGQPSIADGTLVIREDAVMSMDNYTQGTKLTVKNVVNEGTYVYQSNPQDSWFKATGKVSGTGTFTVPVTLTNSAVIDLTPSGSITFANTLTSERANGAIQLSADGIDTVKDTRLSVLRVTEDANLPAESKIVKPTNCSRWNLSLERDGFGYRLVKPYFILIIK